MRYAYFIQLIQYERNIFVVVLNNNTRMPYVPLYCVAYWAEIKILENDMI